MDITPFIPAARQLINGYGAGGFMINHARLEGSVLVLPTRTLAWPVADASQITVDSLAEILTGGVEILLIGTGSAMTLLSPDLRRLLKDRHIACEAMDTGAACRTYNVLLAEERKVAAALVAV